VDEVDERREDLAGFRGVRFEQRAEIGAVSHRAHPR